jgi:glycosyl transferase family 25
MLPAYVIHSTSLPEREDHIRRELQRAGISFEWILDMEPADISDEIDRKYFVPGADLTPGQKSCALKHIVAMQRIVENHHDLAFIVEDDTQFCDDFQNRLRPMLEAAKRWPRPRILHLGAATNFYVPASQIRPGELLYEGTRVRNMELYVLGRPEAEARLDWVYRNRLNEPIDIAFNRADPKLGIPFLWSDPPLAEQGSLNGRFESSLSRKKRNRFRMKVEFGLKRVYRGKIKRWLARR